MKVFFLFFYIFVLAKAEKPDPPACPNDPSERGFSTLADMNRFMEAEAQRIINGGTPEDEYEFILCTNTEIDAEEALSPLLSNASFKCGQDGKSINNCVLDGGPEGGAPLADEKNFINVEVSGLKGVSFMGLTFGSRVTKSWTLRYLLFDSDSEVRLFDCVWDQTTSDKRLGLIFMTLGSSVELTDCKILKANSGTIVNNQGGTLRISGLEVKETEFESVVENGIGANAYIERSTITKCVMASAFRGTTLSVYRVKISENIIRTDVGIISVGFGGDTHLDSIEVTDNTPDGVVEGSSSFSCLQTQDGARLFGRNILIARNKGGSAASAFTYLEIVDSLVTDNEFRQGVLATGENEALIERTRFTNNVFISVPDSTIGSALVSGGQAVLRSVDNCFENNQAGAVALVEGATLIDSENFVQAFETSLCNETSAGRLLTGFDNETEICSPFGLASKCRAVVTPIDECIELVGPLCSTRKKCKKGNKFAAKCSNKKASSTCVLPQDEDDKEKYLNELGRMVKRLCFVDIGLSD